MAYSGKYMGNPDALPAHAEPDQAAAMMSGTGGGRPNYANKPQPIPQMQDLRIDDRYQQRPPPPSQGSYHSGSSPRYDSRPPPPQPSYSSQQYDPRPTSAYSQAPPPAPRYDYAHQQSRPAYSAAPPPAATLAATAAAAPHRHPYASPPPPANYGQGPPPSGYHDRPPIPAAQRPPTTAPPLPPRDGNDRDALWPLFCAVDKDRSGQLSESSLRRALVNGDYTAFDAHTVKMMIRMFDTDRSGTINFDEFCGLWGFLAAWRTLFDRFDVDRSGYVSYQEFQDALVAFGYRLSSNFVQLLFGTFAKSVSGQAAGREKALSFDLFVQACISLKRMTDVFKRYDDDRDGYITLSFEEFLTEILRQR